MSGGSEQAITHIWECHEIRINNQSYKGINLTNTTYACLWTGHIWQSYATISWGRSGSHLSLVHVFHTIPHTGLSVGGLYTIPVLISRGMVGYRPTTTIIEIRWFTEPHKFGMRSVHNQMLIQGSTTNGPQSTQVGATTLEPRVSTYHSPSLHSLSNFSHFNSIRGKKGVLHASGTNHSSSTISYN
jgi:hypothetical protein